MKKTKKGRRNIIFSVFIFLLIGISFLAYYSANWYIEKFGDTGFASILYTLFSGLQGADSGMIDAWKENSLYPTLLLTAGLSLILLLPIPKNGIGFNIPFRGEKKRINLYPFSNYFVFLVALVITVTHVNSALQTVGFPDWYRSMSENSTLYEDEYADPEKVELTFPEKKRNLIYILLESMESSYMSEELGGAMETNLIPNLYNLAEENVSFSHNDGIGGWGRILNTEWTMAAMIAQSAGIPLTVPIYGNDLGQYDKILPGLTTITDILHEEGYYQALMVGSDAAFAGRDKYYAQHGTDHIYDYDTAKEDGIISTDFHDGWWGMEDFRLYEYAKQELTEMAAKDQPFSFTMLTVDTHAHEGHRCSLCDDGYEMNYDNVITCADKQVYNFVRWIMEQDFYENTTIVICGDHLSMDNTYFETKLGDTPYYRTVYNCIINSAVEEANENNRVFTPMDMFPTTLSAMGVQIEGDRLGLGTDLFSNTPTLAEKYGRDELNVIIPKNSTYYMTKFFMG